MSVWIYINGFKSLWISSNIKGVYLLRYESWIFNLKKEEQTCIGHEMRGVRPGCADLTPADNMPRFQNFCNLTLDQIKSKIDTNWGRMSKKCRSLNFQLSCLRIWLSMPFMENSSLLFSSCHLELVFSANSWFLACKELTIFQNNKL